MVSFDIVRACTVALRLEFCDSASFWKVLKRPIVLICLIQIHATT